MYNWFNIYADGIHLAYNNDKNPPENINQCHCRESYEILYIISGSGKYLIEGSVFDFQPGTIIFIPPLEYHALREVSTFPFERISISFTARDLVDGTSELLSEIAEPSDEIKGGRIYKPAIVTENVITLFERFSNALKLPQKKSVMHVRLLLSELIVLLSALKGQDIYHEVEELGARVMRYLNENIDRNIPLDELAGRFFVSKYYLCRAFKKHNGISIHGYINYKRVMYARQLIESGETASGAAYRVGFGDYSAFYRAYVKVFGKAPTDR